MQLKKISTNYFIYWEMKHDIQRKEILNEMKSIFNDSETLSVFFYEKEKSNWKKG